jgi:hypothetical protein
MDPNDPHWLALLDAVTAWGEASARNDTPLPTDDQLRAQARSLAGTCLPGQLDAHLLAELRDAFNDGRQPSRIDLQALADVVRERGYHAHVEHTGGNTATLYAGRQISDRAGDPRWSAAAGPGWFEAPDRKPFADTSEFAVGPDSDDTWAVRVPEHTTRHDLVNLIVAVIDEVETQRTRFAQAADVARDALWATFAERYPEVTSADVAPGADTAFVTESNKLLAGWLDDNWPGTRTVPAHVTAIAAAEPTTDRKGRQR